MHPSSFVENQACDAMSNRVMCAVLTESSGGAIAITPTDVTVDCYNEQDTVHRHHHEGTCTEGLGHMVVVTVVGHVQLLTPMLASFIGGQAIRHDRDRHRPDRRAAEHRGRHGDPGADTDAFTPHPHADAHAGADADADPRPRPPTPDARAHPGADAVLRPSGRRLLGGPVPASAEAEGQTGPVQLHRPLHDDGRCAR